LKNEAIPIPETPAVGSSATLPKPLSEVPIESDPASSPIVSEPPSSSIISSTASTNGKKETPSLFRKKESTENTEVVKKETKSSTFTDEQLQEAWKKFGEMRGSGEAEKLVLNRELSKLSDELIAIQLTSQLEVSILSKLEQDLVQFLRQELENDNIRLEKRITESKQTQKLYTGKDIYEHMVSQNPALKDLKDKLGLDYDF
jgi:hypothetical protein